MEAVLLRPPDATLGHPEATALPEAPLHPAAHRPHDSPPHSESPNIVFQNARRTAEVLTPRLALPQCLRFFVRVKHVRVGLPFPPHISTKKYLHKARLLPGHDGLVAHIKLDHTTVIGLESFHKHTFCHFVLEVPSSATINPTVHPTKLSFHPQHACSLHGSSEGRLIVPVWPHLVSRDRVLHPRRWNGRESVAQMLAKSDRPWVGTFGSGDGRFGPAFVPRIHGLPAALVPAAIGRPAGDADGAAARRVAHAARKPSAHVPAELMLAGAPSSEEERAAAPEGPLTNAVLVA